MDWRFGESDRRILAVLRSQYDPDGNYTPNQLLGAVALDDGLTVVMRVASAAELSAGYVLALIFRDARWPRPLRVAVPRVLFRDGPRRAIALARVRAEVLLGLAKLRPVEQQV